MWVKNVTGLLRRWWHLSRSGRAVARRATTVPWSLFRSGHSLHMLFISGPLRQIHRRNMDKTEEETVGVERSEDCVRWQAVESGIVTSKGHGFQTFEGLSWRSDWKCIIYHSWYQIASQGPKGKLSPWLYHVDFKPSCWWAGLFTAHPFTENVKCCILGASLKSDPPPL